MADKLYTLDTVQKRTKFNAAGQLREVYEVHFITRSGVRDMIEFSPDEYSPEAVKAAVARLAETHEKLFT